MNHWIIEDCWRKRRDFREDKKSKGGDGKEKDNAETQRAQRAAEKRRRLEIGDLKFEMGRAVARGEVWAELDVEILSGKAGIFDRSRRGGDAKDDGVGQGRLEAGATRNGGAKPPLRKQRDSSLRSE